jgi:ABC-type dipeptide/oligopeptide/nickel transport system permease component
VIFIGAFVCVASFVVDLLQLMLDPRIRATQLQGAAR